MRFFKTLRVLTFYCIENGDTAGTTELPKGTIVYDPPFSTGIEDIPEGMVLSIPGGPFAGYGRNKLNREFRPVSDLELLATAADEVL